MTLTPPDARMKACRFNPTTLKLTLDNIPVPKPEADEVLVKVLAAGVCHSDVSALYHPDAVQYPADKGTVFTMGHEGSGIIVELGSTAAKEYPELTPGVAIAIYIGEPCNTCSLCKQGRENLCTTKPLHGIGLDGTWASHIVVPASSVIPVPDGIPASVAAVATDAVLTPYHAIKTVGGVKAGQTVLIIGCGGLGQNAIQIAKHCLDAGTVIACDIREQTLQSARKAGADYAVHPDKLQELLQELKVNVDASFDFVGNQSTFEAALGLIPWGGRMVLVGIGTKAVQMPMMHAVIKEVQILTSFWGTKTELREVLDAIKEGKVTPQVETRPFEDCVQVLEELRDGKLQARAALHLL